MLLSRSFSQVVCVLWLTIQVNGLYQADGAHVVLCSCGAPLSKRILLVSDWLMVFSSQRKALPFSINCCWAQNDEWFIVGMEDRASQVLLVFLVRFRGGSRGSRLIEQLSLALPSPHIIRLAQSSI
jgi:predicted metal-binding membrane protein